MARYQLDHFIQHRKGRFVMSEELWKKVDALEAFVNLYAPYHISNKQWLQMEKFLSVFTVEDDDVVVALDNAMARNLLAEITALLKNKIPTGEKDLIEAMEQIFGDDKIPVSHQMLKNIPSTED